MKRTIPRIFLDTNILLDVLLKREDFYQESAVLFNACEAQEVQGEIITTDERLRSKAFPFFLESFR